ncbi:hypothetical protein GCM10010368_68820 [Streptomyces roseiscleroticus]|uniref:Transposase n=1 Tax=Streptomyces roseiscleroticus TaxID=1972 RepID=A0ABN3F4U8_9ACTN
MAGLIAMRPGSRARLCHRLIAHPAGRGKRRSLGERDFIALIDGAHQLLRAPIVLVWDRLNTHVSHAMRRRHQTLVNCAFSFCWHAGLPPAADPPGSERGHPPTPAASLATDSAGRPQLDHPGHHAATLVESLVQHAPRRHHCRT